ILLVRGQLRRPGRPRLALRQSGVAQVLAHRIPRDAELLGNASDRVVVPIQGVNLFHFSTLQQGPQPPNPLAGSLESRIRWRVGHFHPAPGSRVNRPQHGPASCPRGLDSDANCSANCPSCSAGGILVIGLGLLGVSLSGFSPTTDGSPDHSLFTDRLSHHLLVALLRSFQVTVICLVVELGVGLGLATLWNRDFKGQNIVRSLMLMPLLIAPLILSLLWNFMLHYDYGAVNQFLQWLGLPKVSWWSPRYALLTIAMITVWQWFPFSAFVLLAGLRSLPK